ncbi:Uncharacterized protein APZ42_023523 [Daphnia magna]|uniref:Uncharacterized protein n=1 Tax=Daphnia magna TaxID=35525 RepID=A0A164UVT9_9CRUS|nr:Uncharacterized protein APZ42_023523 [Daphnia magna]
MSGWSPSTVTSNRFLSSRTSLVNESDFVSIVANAMKKRRKFSIPMFQKKRLNLSVLVLAPPPDSRLEQKKPELLNLWWRGFPVSRSTGYGSSVSVIASRIGGTWLSANVNKKSMFSLTSLPKMDSTESKMYVWVGVKRASEACATKPMTSRSWMPFLSWKNLRIISVISSSRSRPSLSP